MSIGRTHTQWGRRFSIHGAPEPLIVTDTDARMLTRGNRGQRPVRCLDGVVHSVEARGFLEIDLDEDLIVQAIDSAFGSARIDWKCGEHVEIRAREAQQVH